MCETERGTLGFMTRGGYFPSLRGKNNYNRSLTGYQQAILTRGVGCLSQGFKWSQF